MAPRGSVLRLALYLVAGGFLLYLAWPLLKGQESIPKCTTHATPVRVSLPVVQKVFTTSTTTETQVEDYYEYPLDGPIQGAVVMAGWKQTNCGNTSDPLRITITHMEFVEGEHLVVAFDIELDIELTSPLQVNMTQWTMVSEDVWNLVPCGEIKGSCYIEDLCTSFSHIKCPSLRGQMEPSMQCPIKPGRYSVPDHHYPTVNEDYLHPVATRYHFKLNGKHIACYDVLVIAEKV